MIGKLFLLNVSPEYSFLLGSWCTVASQPALEHCCKLDEEHCGIPHAQPENIYCIAVLSK